MDKARRRDLEALRRDIKHPRNALQARKIREAAKKITEEQHDKWKVSAREALVKKAKEGRHDEVKEVANEIIDRNEKSVMRLDRIGQIWKLGQYERIFGHD
jgi:hypothetical protein